MAFKIVTTVIIWWILVVMIPNFKNVEGKLEKFIYGLIVVAYIMSLFSMWG